MSESPPPDGCRVYDIGCRRDKVQVPLPAPRLTYSPVAKARNTANLSTGRSHLKKVRKRDRESL
jgi:hypothetical protein